MRASACARAGWPRRIIGSPAATVPFDRQSLKPEGGLIDSAKRMG
jgi:hypothetical protein